MEETQDIEKSPYQTGLDEAWQQYYANDYDLAEITCLGLIAQYPEKSYCYYILGHVYRVRELYQKAVDAFVTSVERDPDGRNNGYAYYWLGELYGKGSWSKDNTKYIFDAEKSEHYYKLARKAGDYPPDLLLRNFYNLENQERIELFEEGITQFPDMPDFYILLAQTHKRAGSTRLQLATFSRALEKDLLSSSLFYNIGRHYADIRDFKTAAEYFEKASANNQNYPGYNFALYYWLGKCNQALGDLTRAEQNYDLAYQAELGNNDCLFGFLGLLDIYLIQNDRDKIDTLILQLDVDQDIVREGGRISGGPISLSEHVTDDINLDNLGEIYQKFAKLKIEGKNEMLNGKTWLLRYFFTSQLTKYSEQYKAIKQAKKFLNVHHLNFLNDFHAEALGNLIYYKAETDNEAFKLYKQLTEDMNNEYTLRKNMSQYIHSSFKLFFDNKAFDKLVALSKFFTQEQIIEHDSLFMLAYANVEIGNKVNAKILYQLYLKEDADSCAVLNNLGLLFDEEHNYDEALALYRRGLLVDPKHVNLNNNLKNTLKRVALQEQRAAQEKDLKDEYQASTNLLKSENDYVLEKLKLFIEQIKKDEGFEDWKAPVAKYKFSIYLNVDKQRADSLLNQWLIKGYLKDTKERADHSVVIYAINPFIEEELTRIQKRKIPQQWIDGFIQLSIDKLETHGYFAIMSKIEKAGKKFRPLLERDFNELIHNYLLGHEKATIILSGSLVELALTYYCEKQKVSIIPVTDTNGKTKNKDLYDCVLSDLIAYVEQTRPFGTDFVHLSNLSRIYRNFVHPGRELKDSLDKAKADLCFLSTVEILKKII